MNGQQIFDQASQAKFFARYGVPEQKFNSMFNSFQSLQKLLSQINWLNNINYGRSCSCCKW
jgi:hypothetical protein